LTNGGNKYVIRRSFIVQQTGLNFAMADRRKRNRNDDMQDDDDGSMPDPKSRGKALQFESTMQFEDPYDDEEEDDENVVDADEGGDGLDNGDVSMMDEDDEEEEGQVKVRWTLFCVVSVS